MIPQSPSPPPDDPDKDEESCNDKFQFELTLEEEAEESDKDRNSGIEEEEEEGPLQTPENSEHHPDIEEDTTTQEGEVEQTDNSLDNTSPVESWTLLTLKTLKT